MMWFCCACLVWSIGGLLCGGSATLSDIAWLRRIANWSWWQRALARSFGNCNCNHRIAKFVCFCNQIRVFVRVRPLNAKEDGLVWIFLNSHICNRECLFYLLLCCGKKRTLLMFEIALWLTQPWELLAAKIRVSLTRWKLNPTGQNSMANLCKVHFAEPPRRFAFDGVLGEPNPNFAKPCHCLVPRQGFASLQCWFQVCFAGRCLPTLWNKCGWCLPERVCSSENSLICLTRIPFYHVLPIFFFA